MVDAKDCQNLEEVTEQTLNLGDDGFDNLVNLEEVRLFILYSKEEFQNVANPFCRSLSLVLALLFIICGTDTTKTRFMFVAFF